MIESLLSYIVIMAIDINGTEMIRNLGYYVIHPYAVAFGGIEVFIGALVGIIAAGYYNQQNKFAIFIVLTSAMFFFIVLMSVTPAGFGILAIFFMVSLFIFASILRRRFAEPRML